MIDLHTHTHYSDGRTSPAELLQAAADRHCSILAITDHDSVSGVDEALTYARTLNIELIPAVEMTTRWDGFMTEVDVLAYFVDIDHAALRQALSRNIAGLRQRVEEITHRLAQKGYAITVQDVEEQNPRAVSYLSVIHALIKNGCAPDYRTGAAIFQEALQDLPLFGIPIQEGINAIRAAGGVAVLAHPPLIRADPPLSAEELAPLIDAGLQGIEILHPSIDAKTHRYYQLLAQKLELVTSGGSDDHGWINGFSTLGTQPVTRAMVDALRGISKQ